MMSFGMESLVEAVFTPPYPNANIWSTTHHIEIRTVNPNNVAATNGACTPTITMAQQAHVFNAILQKQFQLEFE